MLVPNIPQPYKMFPRHSLQCLQVFSTLTLVTLHAICFRLL